MDYLDPKTRATADLEGLDNVRVTGIEVVRPATITPDNRALRLVRIDYVLKDEQTLKQLMDRQDWRYDEERKAWFLHSGLPAF